MITTSNNKKRHKLKTGVEEFVEPLLTLLDSCPEDMFIRALRKLVVEEKKDIERRQQWDLKQISLFGKIERHIDYWKENEGNDSELFWNLGKLVMEYEDSQKYAGFETGEPSNSNDLGREVFSEKYITSEVVVVDEHLESNGQDGHENDDSINLLLEEEYVGDGEVRLPLREFLYSLTVFPEDTKLKKRTLVSWWIGLGLVPPEVNVQGDEIFSHLVSKDILKPVHIRNHNRVIDLCTINPTFQRRLKKSYNEIRKQEVVIDENKNVKRGISSSRFYCHVNVGQKYLNSKEIINTFEKEKNMKVVQLGRWHCIMEDEINNSKGNKSQTHIEVDDTGFLKRVGKHVRYISLQGISNISTFPESIGKLGDLRILDLRACHNLEKLPHKRLMSKYCQGKWFDNLFYLDISECYLLDHMPKWICELSNLQVLKGFIVGSGGKKEESCRLQDLSKLEKLQKLSIRIVNFVDPEDANSLKSLNCLRVLTVTWSINENQNDSSKVRSISFPDGLEKLDIRCYPEDDAVEFLNPEALPNLERLYIRGGRLKRLTQSNSNWNVKVLRLKFLEHLEFDSNDLVERFPSLGYVEYQKFLHFPRKRTAWNTSIDGPFPISPEGPLTMMTGYNYETTLAENKKKMVIRLATDDHYDWKTAKLDLVVALDVSISSITPMDKFNYMKTALLFVIKKLRSTDRLSIVTFSTMATELQPLLEVDESSQKHLLYLVHNLEPSYELVDSKTNIFHGLQMGLGILKDRRNGSEHVAAIILVSDGIQSNDAGDAAHISIGDVAVHTFGLWGDYVVLNSIAYRSMGGTFSYLEEPDELIIAIGQCLAGLLTVVVQDLTLTITTIEKSSTLEWVSSGAEDYPRIEDNDAGSATVNFGYLSSGEVRYVLVNLLPAGEEGFADVLEVSYSCRLSSGSTFESKQSSVSLDRMKMVQADQEAPWLVINNFLINYAESRLKTLEMVKEVIALADDNKVDSALQKIKDAHDMLLRRRVLFEILKQLDKMCNEIRRKTSMVHHFYPYTIYTSH